MSKTNALQTIRKELKALADPWFAQFSSRTVPNTRFRFLGVRMGGVRDIAASFSAEQREAVVTQFLETAGSPLPYIEELLVQAILIGKLRLSPLETIACVQAFLPWVDNWMTCDLLAGELKTVRKSPNVFWDFSIDCTQTEEPFTQRLGIVLLLKHFIDERRVLRILDQLERVPIRDEHYVCMGIAWCAAECYLRFPDKVRPFLLNNTLDTETHNRMLRKICESIRTTDEEREEMRALRRNERT